MFVNPPIGGTEKRTNRAEYVGPVDRLVLGATHASNPTQESRLPNPRTFSLPFIAVHGELGGQAFGREVGAKGTLPGIDPR